jgi:hypothetical protein
MILYFDKIHLISPTETSLGHLGNQESEISNLVSEGVVELISPSELLQEYDSLMTNSIINDMSDQDFLNLAEQSRGRPWEIYSEKVPSNLADFLLRKYFVDVPNFFAGKPTMPSLREGPYYHPQEGGMRELIRRRHQTYEEIKERGEHRYDEYHEFRRVTLPFEVGESIMINHALCAADHFTLTPITDDPIHHDFLLFKYRKMQNTPLLRRLLRDYRFIKDTKTNLTAVNIISETVPVLAGADIADVLEFRDQNKGALETFRVEMAKLATEIKVNFWDDDFYKEVVDITDSIVKPSIQNLKASAESTKEKFTRILSKGAKISSLPIIVSVIPGSNPELALVAGAGVFALDEYLERQKRKREKQKNGFVYLFEAQKRFSG